ncbi:hypothetical protein [Candidatus Thiodiazotropha sp. LNASS1]
MRLNDNVRHLTPGLSSVSDLTQLIRCVSPEAIHPLEHGEWIE